MSEGHHIPYQAAALPVPGASCVLVLAPHPDDETIGCGGTSALYAKSGVTVNTLILTDGGLWGVPLPGQSIVQTRKEETQAAALVLGTLPPVFAGHQDRQLPQGEALVEEIVQHVKKCRADTLFAPSLWEIHPDHKTLAHAAIQAIQQLGDGYHLVQYEVGMPLMPNVLVDITSVFEIKQKAMACFTSQLAMQSYDRQVNGLNAFRTYTLPLNVKAAEGLRVCTAQEVCDDPYGLVFEGNSHPLLKSMDLKN